MGKYDYSFFNQIDIFGVSPIFTIRGRSTFQTNIGSFLTIICIMIVIIYISIFLDQMINHKSPNLNTTIYYNEIPPEVNLTKNNFSFVFSLQTKDYKNYIDESIYTVDAVQSKMKFNENGSYNYEEEILKIIKCNEYEFKIIPDKFKKLPLNNLYCLNNNINLKGDFMKDNWNFIRFNFTKCVNSSNNNNKCKSENEINELLNGGYLGIFIPDYTYEPNIYNKPYKTYIKNLYKSFSIKYFEDIFIYFKLVEIITDSGYFFEIDDKLNFINYDYIQNEIDFKVSQQFLSLTLRFSSKREIHKRNYMKFTTIVSNVGGMLKIILLIGEYCVYIIRITLYKNYILEFFNLDENSIRLKLVKKKYNLPGVKTMKNNLDKHFVNLSNLSCSNNKSKIDEESSEYKSNHFNNENMIFNKLIGSINSMKLTRNKSNLLKQNNYILQKEDNKRRKSKEAVVLLYQGKRNSIKSLFNNNIKNYNKKIQNNKFKAITNNNIENQINTTLNEIRTLNIKKKKNIIIPKTQLRIIKVPGFCSDFICKKNTYQILKQVHENYKEIQFLLDIVHYLKLTNELNIIGKYLFTDEQRKILSYTYTFEADYSLEKQGYDYMIKHEINKLDEESNESTQKL